MSDTNMDSRDLVAQALAGMVRELAPASATNEEIAQALDWSISLESTDSYRQVFEALFDPRRVKERPRWGLALRDLSHPEKPHIFHAPKRMDRQSPLGDVASFAMALGAFCSPVVRAVLLLHGYRPEWVEVEQPAILLAH